MLSFLFFIQLASAAPQPLAVNVGEPAIVFALPALNQAQAVQTVNKASVSLSDFVGVMPSFPKKAVLVHFFTRKSGVDTLKALQRVQKKNETKGVQVLGVCACGGDPQKQSEWIESQNLNFPVIHDGHRVVTGRYGITELPITVVVDGIGNVFAIGRPSGEAAEQELQSEIDGLTGR